jgi:hypothetical protein
MILMTKYPLYMLVFFHFNTKDIHPPVTDNDEKFLLFNITWTTLEQTGLLWCLLKPYSTPFNNHLAFPSLSEI